MSESVHGSDSAYMRGSEGERGGVFTAALPVPLVGLLLWFITVFWHVRSLVYFPLFSVLRFNKRSPEGNLRVRWTYFSVRPSSTTAPLAALPSNYRGSSSVSHHMEPIQLVRTPTPVVT